VLDKRGAAFLSADPTRMCGANSQITVQQLSLDSLCRSGSLRKLTWSSVILRARRCQALAGAEDLFAPRQLGRFSLSTMRHGFERVTVWPTCSSWLQITYTAPDGYPWGVTRTSAYGIGWRIPHGNLLLTRPGHVMLLKPVGRQ